MKVKTKKIIKTLGIAILLLHVTLYFFIGDILLRNKVYGEFEEFCTRRHNSKTNFEHISEWFFLASCGDEFFRDRAELERLVKKADRSFCDPKKDTSCYDTFRNIETIDYNFSLTDLIRTHTTDSLDVSCITFSVCRLNNVHFLFTRIDFSETFSVHDDFHAMASNEEQGVLYNSYYVWFIFNWFRITKRIEEPLMP